MSMNSQNLIRSVNDPKRHNMKDNHHSLSPNVRPIYNQSKPVKNNNILPKNRIMYQNNNYNIKVNVITKKKEKVIEGDLNFNNMSKQNKTSTVHKPNFLNKKGKNPRGMPRKSPLPIPRTFKPKGMLNFNRIFTSKQRPNTKKINNKSNNFMQQQGNLMKNNIFGSKMANNTSKSFNSLSLKHDRSHSPILRSGQNKIMFLGMKNNKNRYVSKSPILGKSSAFNRNNGNMGISLLNNNNGNNQVKKMVRKAPVHNNNNIMQKKVNNINNINSSNAKRNTIISGEINQDSSKFNKMNSNPNANNSHNVMNINNNNIRPIPNNNLSNAYNVNHNINNNNNINVININVIKDRNEKELKSNNINNNNINQNNINVKNNERLMNKNNNKENINPEVKNIIKQPLNKKDNINSNNMNNNINNNMNNINMNNNNMDNNINNNNINNNNMNNNNISNKVNNNVNSNANNNMNNYMNNNINNNVQKVPEIKKETNIIKKEEEPIKINNNNNNINNIKVEETKNKKTNNRSQSQGPTDPLKRNEESEKKEVREEEIKENKEINKNKDKKVTKIIKDLLPYTHVGFDGEEPKENNQDNYFIFKNFAEKKDYIYMSVCDGHGVEGHFVSEFIKEILPYYMSENLKDRNILKETELVHKIITETFLIVNNMLVDNENINSLFSGSTCVSVIYTPERLIVPNIGDSRAVLGRYDKATGKYKAIDLSRDHKPTEKDEAKRIYENDGRIQPFTEEGEFVGPQRVWIKDEEVPGLAMTRSFGDRVAATVGVMSEPEIKEFDFDENDKFMIIASDGIWEFISSQECVDMIQSYYESNDIKGCCEYLYQESSRRWLKEEEVIDDTTLILVFFE